MVQRNRIKGLVTGRVATGKRFSVPIWPWRGLVGESGLGRRV